MDKKALKRMCRADFTFCTHAQLASYLGIHQTNISRAYASGPQAEGVSPALLRAMADKGYLDPAEVAAVLTVPVPPCPECGEVHTKGHPQPGRQDTRRFAAYVSPELFEEVTAEARRRNVTNGEMTEAMWTAYQWTTGQSMLILTPDVSLADEAVEE